jgi:hypothetical protein
MNCQEIQEHLSQYLDNRLDGEERREIEEHLAVCPRCLPEAKLLSDGIKGVAALPEIDPPAGFSKRIMTQIRSEAETPTLWARLFRPLTIKLPLHATALVLVAGLAVYLYRANDPIQQGMVAPSMPSVSAPSLKKEEAKPIAPPLKEEAPVMAVPAPPLERQRFADSGRAADLTDRLESSAQEKRAAPPPAQGLMKSMEGRSDTGPAAEASSQSGNIAADSASPDAALTLRADGAIDKTAALTSRIKEAAERSGGKVFALIKDPAEGTLKSNYWLNLPPSEYDRFKTELSRIGRIVSESQPAAAAPKSDLKPSPSIQVRITVIVENSKASEPAAPPNPN